MSNSSNDIRENFPVLRKIPTRWMDVDNYGHVNNVEYLSYFDTAVNGWYIENGLLDPANAEQIFLVVETQCSYYGEIRFPDIVAAGLRIIKIGNSSVSFEIALFRNDETSPCASGRYVHVLVDKNSRKPATIGKKYQELFSTALSKSVG